MTRHYTVRWLRERLHRLSYERVPRWSGMKVLLVWFSAGVLELLTYQLGRVVEEMADLGRVSCPESALGPCPGDVTFIGRWLMVGMGEGSWGALQATVPERLAAWAVTATFFLIPAAVVIITWRWLSSAPQPAVDD